MKIDDPRRCASPADTPRQCQTCNAAWNQGDWTWGCVECGGGSTQMPCEQCLGRCDAVMYRDDVASNLSGRAHFLDSFGPCTAPGELKEKAVSFEQAVRAVAAPRLPLRVELIDWCSDAAWHAQPQGPPALRALLDAVEHQGLRPSARVVAHSLFGQQEPLPELPRLRLENFFQNPGSLVVLEPITPPPPESGATRLCRIHRVLNPGHWLMRGRETELPITDPLQLPQRRHLAVVEPKYQLPGLLIAEALETGTNELELIDLHRRLIAAGKNR